MYKLIKILILSGIGFWGLAGELKAEPILPEVAVDSLKVLMEETRTALLGDKKACSDKFKDFLVQVLKQEDSFSIDFAQVPFLGVLASKDGLVKVFTWDIPTEKRDVSNYYGIILRRKAKENKFADVFVLNDTKANVKLPEFDILHFPNWYGCVYYEMVEKTDGKKTYYTLIGFDSNDGVSHKKYIEALTFDKNENPVFGAPIFMLDKKTSRRVVFEYTSQSVMMVRYYSDVDQIVYNYLYPIVQEKKNDKRYYVPDVTYEGMMFKLGKWIKIPTVDIRRKN